MQGRGKREQNAEVFARFMRKAGDLGHCLFSGKGSGEVDAGGLRWD